MSAASFARRHHPARFQRHVALALAALALALALVASPARADEPPRLLESPEVAAPSDGSIPAGASVRLEITIDATGAVTEARVIESLRPDVDALVLDASRRMRFQPAERGGQAVPARVRFRFRLTATPPAPTPTPTPGAETPPTPPPGAPPATPETPPDGEPVGEATVRSRRSPGAATTMTLRAEELTTVPGTFGEPTRVVATMPGVARTPFGLGLFVVRGASFENTGFFIDGFPVPVLYHFGFGPAVISSRLVGELNFYPGGYPSEYGRFSAGVISLTTRPPPTDRVRGEFEIDLLKASAMAVVPFDRGRGTIAVAARRSYYDWFIPLFVDGVALEYGDYQVRMDYRFSPRTRLSLFVFGSYDSLDRTAATGVGTTAQESQQSLSYTFHRMITRFETELPGRVNFSIAGSVGWDSTSFSNSQPGQADLSTTLGGFILGERVALRVPTGRHLTTTLGLDVQAIAFNVDLTIPLPPSIGAVPPPLFDPVTFSTRATLTQLGVAGYLEETLRAGPAELTAGMRVDRLKYGTVETVIADPRLVSRLRLHPRLTWIAATGFFHQPPPFPQLLPQVGNPGLRPIRSWQSSTGVELDLPFNLETRLTGFYSRMYNLQRTSNEVVTTNNMTRRQNLVDDGQGRAYGLEVLIRRRLLRGVYGWLSYTLSRSERFVEGARTIPFNFDQTHVLNLAVSWEINARWRIGARFQLATGNPTRPVVGAFYDADTDRFRPEFPPRTEGCQECDRLPTYHQLDVRVDYRFRWGPMQFSAYLDVLNAYYAQNAEGWLYQYDFARRVPFPGIPILPTIGIRGEL